MVLIMPASCAVMPSDGPIRPTRICGANRFVTMTPTAIAANQMKERVVVPLSNGSFAASETVIAASQIMRRPFKQTGMLCYNSIMLIMNMRIAHEHT